jgi:hypothetical protein
MIPSSFDKNFYGCPRCDWPLDPTEGEWEEMGGVTCPCGGFVPLPDIPVPPGSIYREWYEKDEVDSDEKKSDLP